MRKADIVIGAVYAVRDTSNFSSTEVFQATVATIEHGAYATVTRLDPSPPGKGKRPAANNPLRVRTQDVVCVWDDVDALRELHAAKRAAEDAEREARYAEWEAERQPDPNRGLPASYNNERYSDDERPDQFEELVNSGRRMSRAVPGCLDLLPSQVRRDMIASAQQDPRGSRGADVSPASNTVGDVYAAAVCLATSGRTTTPVAKAIASHDAAFVAAAIEHYTATVGGSITLPFVPRLAYRGRNGGVDIERVPLGWLRVAYGETDGERLHEPECFTLSAARAGRYADSDEAPKAWPTMPLWRLDIGDACGSCGGPGVLADAAWVAFRAASDVWAARGRSEPETWQVEAVLHLVASAAVARANVGEADHTLEAVVLDTLAENRPGLLSGDAQKVMAYGPHDLTPAAEEAAIGYAVERITFLSELLPHTLRVNQPASMSEPSVQSRRHGLREWFEHLCYDLPISNRYLAWALFGPGSSSS